MIDTISNINVSHTALSMADAIQSALTDGSSILAVLALSGVAVLSLIPGTLVHPAFCFTIGYGVAVAAMSLAMMVSFQATALPRTIPELLLHSCFIYGIRLAGFLLWRLFCVQSMKKQLKPAEKLSKLQASLMSFVLSGLYACMVSPVLFGMRENASTRTPLQWIGVVLAYIGLALEVVTDQQKYLTKRRHKSVYGEKRFVGPTSGCYTVCRHPNFLGEIMFWTGVLLGSMTSFGRNITPWICGLLGWVGIVKIMVVSTKGLEKKQVSSYGGQSEFDEWRKRVKASLIPFFW